MVVLAVVLAGWLLLTLPAAVLMGKCISRGLAHLDEPDRSGASSIPTQRFAPQGAALQGGAAVGRTQV